MSYNTRRNSNQPQHVGNFGQRRPVVTNNFVPGGQLQPQQQQKPQGYNNQQQQQPQRLQQQGQQQAQINFRNQQQRQNYQPQQNYGNQAPAQQQNFPQVKPEPSTPSKPQQQPDQVLPGANPPAPEPKKVEEAMDTTADSADKQKKKPAWIRGGKISRREKLRRRNLRLSKMLQPKNAVMILHELVKDTIYQVEELSCKIDNNQYKATVMFEGENHVGLGRSKIQAKNAAAENALKYFVKNKQLKLSKVDGESENGKDNTDDSEKMDVQSEGAGIKTVMPWQHVASFALFKLFSSWGEDPVLTTRQAQEMLGLPKTPTTPPGSRAETKPARKMPENPEQINPLMLLNQMCPLAQFDEVGKVGTPPNVTFTFQVTLEGQTFTGSGPNKKTAKRMAAYAACHNVLKINYPPEIWVPGF